MSVVIARHELALGVAPRDAGRTFRASPIDVAIDRMVDDGHRPTFWPPASGRRTPDGLVRLVRQPSGTHTLLRSTRFTSPVTLRITDENRRFVPRKLRVAVPPGTPVVIEPTLFPGAAYDIHARATGVRGRVVDGTGRPRRWARIEARRAAPTPGAGLLIGHAHGDDRGEFLLLAEPNLVGIGALPATAEVELTAYVADPAPTPASPELPSRDLYWDLPVELVEDGATVTDPILAGTELPADYSLSNRVIVNLELGFLRSSVEIVIN